jgi:hypothetical protein
MSDDIHLERGDALRLRTALESSTDHLSDEDLVNRAFDDGTIEEKARIDAHVSACPECQAELARTRAIAAEMNSEDRRSHVDRGWEGFVRAAGRNRIGSIVAGFCDILVPGRRLATRGGPPVTAGAQPEDSAGSPAVGEGSTPDGRLAWRFTEEKSGGLRGLIVCSDVESLRGASIWLNTNPPRPVTLIESAGELRAELTVSLDEWSRLARGPIVQKVVSADGDVIASTD